MSRRNLKVILQKVYLDSRELLFLSGAQPRIYQRWVGGRWERVTPEWAATVDIPRDALVEQWPGKEETA